MFQFPPCPPTGLCVQPAVTEYCSAGFPHSGTSGSTSDDNSPELIAAIRALLRLLAPRHPPHALSSLIHVRRQHLMLLRRHLDSAYAVLYVLLLFHSVVKVPPAYATGCLTILGPLAAAPKPPPVYGHPPAPKAPHLPLSRHKTAWRIARQLPLSLTTASDPYPATPVPFAKRYPCLCGPEWTRTTDPCVISTVL